MAEDLPQPAASELIPAEALARVPGYGAGDAVILSRLPGGRVNRTYSLQTPTGKYVVRVTAGTDAWLAPDRSVELELQGLAAGAGLAPRIVHADACDRWLITEFVPGPTWTDEHFARADCLARLGDTLRWLHGIPPPPRQGHFDLLEALTRYAQRLERQGAAGSSDSSQYVQEAAFASQVAGGPDRPKAVLHHDLHGSNLIDAERGLTLIDWECAAVNDPLLDVACVLSYFDSARAHADVLLRHAGLGSVTEKQLAASVWLFDLHTWLWYRERRTRLVPTAAEVEAEGRLAVAVESGLARVL
jgi:aminoglycoside phosphotransferase (APT) family kinase protein